jgi:hypothetical protein
VEGDFFVRGGIKTRVTVQHRKSGSPAAAATAR